LAADGQLIGYTQHGTVVRAELSMPVPPAYKQPEQQQGVPELQGTTSIATCQPSQLAQNWGALLASGEGADVCLKCSDGATLRAHSAVLLAHWQYYQVRQRATAAGMTGGSAAGEVDVSEHSAATMQLVLQHLYTGRVQLPTPAAAAACGSTAGRGGEGQSAVGTSRQQDTGDEQQLAAGISNLQVGAEETAQSHNANLQQLVELARAADALLLPSLHASCLALLGKAIKHLLTPSTALDLLLAAHMAPGGDTLEEEVMSYIRDHVQGGRVREVGGPKVLLMLSPTVLVSHAMVECVEDPWHECRTTTPAPLLTWLT
jgi:hypothetical protein